ncbi:MAG: hypothetical protein ACD_26C00117G0002 [uncultured bacterium]|nr:MAG: hypothetical protein ACD_26C00117G0002 [uncultured bacterium]
MSSSADFYTKEKAALRDKFFSGKRKNDNSTEYLINICLEKVSKINIPSILDLGTGNGFVIKQIVIGSGKLSEGNYYGVDLSNEMVEEAKMYCKDLPEIKILQADNFALPFENSYFDLVTDKASTNISAKEIFRILKDNGWFVFKEYSLGKGMKELVELFPGRFKLKDPLDYIRDLREAGFSYINYEQFHFKKNQTKDELKAILSMAPIMIDYNEKVDFPIIDNYFRDDVISLTSDPFIISARK